MSRHTEDTTTDGGKTEARHPTRRSIVGAGPGIALGAAISPLTRQSGQAQTPSSRARTVILASHPYPERSIVNKALWQVAQNVRDSSFRNLETEYGDNMRGFDRAAERQLYAGMERLVLIFPTHWFNLTPMLKAYLNEIWVRGRRLSSEARNCSWSRRPAVTSAPIAAKAVSASPSRRC